MSFSIPYIGDYVYRSPSDLPDLFRVKRYIRVFREAHKGRLMVGNMENVVYDMSTDFGFWSWLNTWMMVAEFRPEIVYTRVEDEVFIEPHGKILLLDWVVKR